MTQISYNVGELRRLVKESVTNEFKPVLGKNVASDDKKNSQETYKEAEKRAKDYDGGLAKVEKKPLQPRMSGNKTTLDYDYDAPPSDQFDERVEAQVNGYSSPLEKNNGIEKSGDYEGNKRFYDNERETAKIYDTNRENIRTSGLVSKELKEKDPEYGKVNSALKENRTPVKRLTFKHTCFFNESQIFNKIPEDFKKDGNIFIVRDAKSDEYLVEWCVNEKQNLSEGRIIKQRNLKEASTQLDRMMQLFEYKQGSGNGKNRVDEDSSVKDTLAAARKIIG